MTSMKVKVWVIRRCEISKIFIPGSGLGSFIAVTFVTGKAPPNIHAGY